MTLLGVALSSPPPSEPEPTDPQPPPPSIADHSRRSARAADRVHAVRPGRLSGPGDDGQDACRRSKRPGRTSSRSAFRSPTRSPTGRSFRRRSRAALAKKLKLADVFATIKKARPSVSIPLVAMVSYSIVYRYGLERFLATMKESGFDGLILPDLPPPEAEAVVRQGAARPGSTRSCWSRRRRPPSAARRSAGSAAGSSTTSRSAASPASGTSCRRTWRTACGT